MDNLISNLSNQNNQSQNTNENQNPITYDSLFDQLDQEAQERKEALLAQFEMQKKARTLALPTEDKDVKKQLRKLKHPICLFGENAENRRDRLRDVLMSLINSGAEIPELITHKEEKDDSKEKEKQEMYFTEGSHELYSARLLCSYYSLLRAKERIQKQKNSKLENADQLIEEKARISSVFKKIKNFTCQSSQIADGRPISSCAISPDNHFVVTGSWSGSSNIWSIPDCNLKFSFEEHLERVSDVKFHPYFISISDSDSNEMIEENSNEPTNHPSIKTEAPFAFATSSLDSTIKLWSLTKEESLMTLKGHTDRISKIAIHPTGKYLGSTSFDKTWKLWDIETGKTILTQPGHTHEVYAIDFHCDGSLVCTAGYDAIAFVWDLRTGHQVMVLDGHVEKIMSAKFSPQGFQISTASDDHTVKIWDIRKKKNIYTLPAHSKLISNVLYEKKNADFLITSSYDNSVKFWSTNDWSLQKTLRGHDAYVLDFDISLNSQFFVSCAEKTWKFWTFDD
ncbi:u4/u6 small nuclear ribonucleoprotein prp4 [Anaeramoeba ignava]|uniref:U4/u6 small nuclear ribonucleoprotein prp4 n=1 Tax=Anaeramoeba ignava TaxID=1746090 RepID=A0A9Q0L930_ANAIG|nr:u4/u6 small nuclear ribonucleoprotein prp4 [Anaeramoeba ignava]